MSTIDKSLASIHPEGSKSVMSEKLGPQSLKASFDISNFDLNAILRGMQLTLVGGKCALLSRVVSLQHVRSTQSDMHSSSSSLTKSGHLHQQPLQAGRCRRGCRHSNQVACLPSSELACYNILNWSRNLQVISLLALESFYGSSQSCTRLTMCTGMTRSSVAWISSRNMFSKCHCS